MRFGFRKRVIEMVVLAVMLLAGTAYAQTTTTETKAFEILAVRGNVLVIREASGTRELIVPPDFRFNVDGKSLAVTDLRPGMKGTATVTKTTISVPVYVTDVKDVTVAKTLGASIIVQDAHGDFRMYSQGDIDQRGINVIMDGKAVRFEDLQVGDRLTASIITEAPPQKMTKTEVDLALAQAAGAPKPAPTGGSATTVTTTETTPTTPTDTTGEAPVEVSPAPADTAAAAATPASSSMLLWLGLIFVVLVIALVLRRRARS